MTDHQTLVQAPGPLPNGAGLAAETPRPASQSAVSSAHRVVFESETRLHAPVEFTLPHLAGGPDVVVGAPVTAQLETTYYDSGDLALATLGYSLRHRVGEEGLPWTLRMPTGTSDRSGGDIRREVAFDGDAHTVPPGARDLLHLQLRSRLLLEVARLESTRTTIPISSRGGVPVAEVVYDDVTAFRGEQQVNRFGEVQVHTVDLDRAGADIHAALVRELVAHGCVIAPSAPKLLRTFGVLSPIGMPAVPSRRGRPGSVGEALTDSLSSSLARLAEHDLGVRLDEDIEDVHQLRVATRRLRSDLRTFGYLLDNDWQRHLRTELGWLGSLAGPVRDADVLLLRLDAALATLPEPESLLGRALTSRLADQRARDRDTLLAGLRSARYDLLLDSVADAATHPRFSASGRRKAQRRGRGPLASALTKQWTSVVDSVAALGDEPSVPQLHQVRIKAKRCRYSAEASAPVLGRPAARLARAATEIQTVLGDLHDSVVAQEWLRDAVQFEPVAAVAGGELIAGERIETRRLRDSWQDVWRVVEPQAARSLAALR